MVKEFSRSTGVTPTEPAVTSGDPPRPIQDFGEEAAPDGSERVDLLKKYKLDAIAQLKKNAKLIQIIKSQGMPWRGIVSALEDALPSVIDATERNRIAYGLVSEAMNEIVGVDKWESEKRPKKTGTGLTVYVVFRTDTA
jgi:hypothetical protein